MFQCILQKLFKKSRYPSQCEQTLIYTISPDAAICERGFSATNYIKNQYQSRLTQNKLNACMALAIDKRTVGNFLITK